MTEEMRALTHRVTGLEVAVARMQGALGGISQVLQQTAAGPVTCAKCENDITGMSTCAIEDCPCGFPATIEEPVEGHDPDAAAQVCGDP